MTFLLITIYKLMCYQSCGGPNQLHLLWTNTTTNLYVSVGE